MASKTFKANNNKVFSDSGDKTNKTVINSSNNSKNNKSKNLTYLSNIRATREPKFLILGAKKPFKYLLLAFIKAPILCYFNPKSHIQIETDASGYVIGRVLSQLNLDFNTLLNKLNLNKSDFGQWH